MERVLGDAANLGLAVDIGTTTVAVYLCDMETGTVLATRAFRNPQAAYGADVISRIDKIMKDKKALAEQQRLISNAVREAGISACGERGLSFADVRAAVLCGNTVMEHIAAGIDPSSIANAPFTSAHAVRSVLFCGRTFFFLKMNIPFFILLRALLLMWEETSHAV